MNGLPYHDAKLKAEKYRGKNSKTLEKLGCKKYMRAIYASKYGNYIPIFFHAINFTVSRTVY
jgi:hypothetical protein